MSRVNRTAERIADWFLSRVDRQSGDTITHLKLQKLVYYAQAWHLANFNKPLFHEDMEAWAHGPVAPSLWSKYRDARWEALSAPEKTPQIDADLEAFLEKVYAEYGRFEAKFLENLTHKEDPWRLTRGDLEPYERCSKSIPKGLMRDYYGQKIGKAWEVPIAKN